VAAGAAGGGGEDTSTTTTLVVTDPVTTTRPTATTLPQGGTLPIECSASPESGPPPLAVRFDAGATGASVNPSFVWDFGDGTGAAGSAVQHVYGTAGRFTATVTGTTATATGTCSRTIVASATQAPTRTLSVKVGGTGGGAVSSTPGGIECRAACSAPFPLGSDVTLRADAQAGSKFSAWGGACSGQGDCVVKMTSDLAVEATFERTPVVDPTFALTVNRTGASPANVRSTPAGIDCGSDCSERYAAGTSVSLDIPSAELASFLGWSGDCGGTGGCTVAMTQDRSVTARFKDATTPTTTTTTTTTTTMPASVALTVQLQGAGAGTVSGAGIDCPGTCSANQTAGSTVTIQAQAGPSSVFSGWSADCAGASNNCTLTMNAARTARARFDALYRLDVTIQGTGRVRSDSQINCPGVCTETRVDGAVITLVAQITTGGAFQGWDGPCTSDATPEVCTVTMTQHRAVRARFGGVIPLTTPDVAWRSTLDAPGARGTVRVGTQVVAVEPGERLLALPSAGETVVEAAVAGGRRGTWRFEATDIEPGSLRVIAGEALAVGASSVAFRVGPDARVAFAYRPRSRP
jgi:hypothetical protein